MPPPPQKRPPGVSGHQRASTRATGGPARPTACSPGLSLVQGDLCITRVPKQRQPPATKVAAARVS
eukprot:6316435-Prymnesium_polylepis.1